MSLPEILGVKDPADFISRQVRVSRKTGLVMTEEVGEEMNFGAMSALRKQGKSPELMQSELDSDGTIVANVGASSSITVTIEGIPGTYLLTVYQERPDFKDSVLKLVSGYRDSRVSLLEITREELGEEVINVDGGRILRGEGTFAGSAVELPAGKCNNPAYTSQEQNILVSDGNPQMPWLLSLDSLSVKGHPTARMMYFAPLNTAQLIVPVHLHLMQARGSLYHTEDQFKAGKLEVKLDQDGLVLLGMNGSHLTGETYRFIDGKLERGPEKQSVKLSESFAPPSYERIVTSSNLPLEQYLESQKN